MIARYLILLFLASGTVLAAKLNQNVLLTDQEADDDQINIQAGKFPDKEDVGTKTRPHTDWDSYKRNMLEMTEYREKVVGPLPRSCEEAGNPQGIVKLYTGDVYTEANGFRLVEKTVDCSNGQTQDTEEVMTISSALHPRDCLDILHTNPLPTNRVYEVYHPQHYYWGEHGWTLLPIFVYCDMETDGGGWTLFQRRQDGSVDFDRTWVEYEQGFGHASGEHWLGLHFINLISSHRDQELLIRMQKQADPDYWSYAMYYEFTVADASDNYKLGFGCFIGNDTEEDAFRSQWDINGMQFSTHDNDNDAWNFNCAQGFNAGFWFKNCGNSNLNGLYFPQGSQVPIHWGNNLYNQKKFVSMAFKGMHFL